MAKVLSPKQQKASELATHFKIGFQTYTELFKKLKDKGYEWDREMSDWVNPGQVFQLTIKWGDDGFLEEIADKLITHLQDEYPEHDFNLCNTDYRLYTPKNKEGELMENCEAVTLYFKSQTAKEPVTIPKKDSDTK